MKRLLYLDGKMVGHDEAAISPFDTGFMYGATVYESLRTFGHRVFRLEDHLARLARSLRYIGLEPGPVVAEVKEAIEKVLAANLHLAGPGEDIWMCAEVTPGRGFPHPALDASGVRPTVIVFDTEMPCAEYAAFYDEGARVITAGVPNMPPEVIDPRVKHRSRLHFFLAKREALSRDPGAYALLRDTRGFVSEGTGANVFIIRDGRPVTPPERNILAGISRRTVIELAAEAGIPALETDINLYDVYNAEEAFLTTSTYCILPVSSVDGRAIGTGRPGPVTLELLGKWGEMVGLDIAGQARECARAGKKAP